MSDLKDNQFVEQQLIGLSSDVPEIYEAAKAWFLDQELDVTAALVEGLNNEGLGSVGHWRILLLLRHYAQPETLPAILKALYRALSNNNPIVLPGAMEALVVFRTPEATDAMISLLKEDDPDIVQHAAILLGQMGDIKAIKALLSLLENDNPFIRYSAIRGLSQLDDPPVRAALEKHLNKETDSESRELISTTLKRDVRDVP